MEDWLTAAARARPDHEAVAADGGSLTYGQLDERASHRARGLAAAGVGAGDRVPVTHPPGLAFAELLHALPRLGAVLEPGPPTDPPAPAGAEGGAAPLQPRTEFEPDAIHTVIRTSGTTGAPKPVELTYANHAASALASAGALGVEPGDRWLCALPLHHVGGLNVLIRSVINRTTVVLHERFDADRVKATLEAGGITLASLVPTMLARLRAAGLRDAPGLRAIALGGGPVPAELLDWASETGIPVVPVYGMTETCSQVVAGNPGRPLPGVELEIATDGEILVRGAMVAPGERGEDGWLHTGDLGALDADGRLHVLGRLKELIVTGGENVAPLEVEQALLAHPAVVDAGVAGLPDPEWGEAVTAFVVLREPAAAEELRAWCRERLAAFKVPKAVFEVERLPRSAGGKLLRDRLGAD
ncbi:MAG: o-succinylbenzoate---CoA ligase [Thermoleophilaceae bacterium]|nr:o-succinylbenzoate---CoA ligase [Thermoleophilaceae bacterium]